MPIETETTPIEKKEKTQRKSMFFKSSRDDEVEEKRASQSNLIQIAGNSEKNGILKLLKIKLDFSIDDAFVLTNQSHGHNDSLNIRILKSPSHYAEGIKILIN